MKKLVLILFSMVLTVSLVAAAFPYKPYHRGEIQIHASHDGMTYTAEFGVNNGFVDGFDFQKDEYFEGGVGLFFKEDGEKYSKWFKKYPTFTKPVKEWKLVFKSGEPNQMFTLHWNPAEISQNYRYFIDCGDGEWRMTRRSALTLFTGDNSKQVCMIEARLK
ncbi:hypothetical protein JW968_04550 [Candidatus Woesearchaeota archaeon]|nr:hypothetical protein [Candidatus Woesearchaeota archaeon]